MSESQSKSQRGSENEPETLVERSRAFWNTKFGEASSLDPRIRETERRLGY